MKFFESEDAVREGSGKENADHFVPQRVSGEKLSGGNFSHRKAVTTESCLCRRDNSQIDYPYAQRFKIIAGSAGVSISGPLLRGATVCETRHLNVLEHAVDSASYTPKFFNSEQMQSIDVLFEIIIPEDKRSPGARVARVCNYIDGIIAELSKEGKALWLDGLAAVNKMAELAHGKNLRDCTQDQQRALVERISGHEEHPATLEDRFFVALKRATVNGYYMSKIGIHKELDYQGNAVLLDFEGCQHEEHKS